MTTEASGSDVPEAELRRLAWDFFEWSENPPVALNAEEQRKIAKQLIQAAHMISTLRAERDDAHLEGRVAALEHRVAMLGLSKRIDELLETNTRFAEERRGVDLHAMVGQFHRTGGYPVRHSPAVPADDEMRFRFRLIVEEFFEQFDACFQGVLQRQLVADAKDKIRQVLAGPIGAVDLAQLADAWADLKYVVVGSEVTFGVDGNAVFRVVHAANMAKFGPGARRDANGKTMKPPGWTPPDIEAELDRQRREEAKHA